MWLPESPSGSFRIQRFPETFKGSCLLIQRPLSAPRQAQDVDLEKRSTDLSKGFHGKEGRVLELGFCEPQWEVQLHSREKRLSGLRVWNNAICSLFFLSYFFFLLLFLVVSCRVVSCRPVSPRVVAPWGWVLFSLFLLFFVG